MPLASLEQFLCHALADQPRVRRLVVGLSAGMDSSALLHALATLAPRFDCALAAVHVHHGLSPHADAWAGQAEAMAADLGLSCQVVRVQVRPAGSLEAAAREARRAAFAQTLHAGDALLLAHHQEDQAETLLFRLLRGAGVSGLGAMPAQTRLTSASGDVLPIWRPWLDVPRAAVLAYAQTQGLRWVDDESNADIRHARNFLRLEIMPRLRSRWPVASATLAATARRLQEADALLNEYAAQLAESVLHDDKLDVAALLTHTDARQRLLLRYWLQRQGFALPDEVQLAHLRRELLLVRPDAEPCWRWGDVEVRCYRQFLYVMRPLAVVPADWSAAWDGQQPLQLPDGRWLHMQAPGRSVTVRYRRGGERMRLPGHAHSRALKSLLQESALPPWERQRLPLLWQDEALLCVAGVQALATESAPVVWLRATA